MDKKQIEAIWPNIIVEERIGKGSFGEVYRVCRRNFDRVYYSAVKVIEIPREESDLQELRRDGMDESTIRGYYQDMMMQLAQEIDLMESLKATPNVVTIEDFCVRERTDQIGWAAYIRMELLENLNDYLERCGISPQQVARLGADICSALECCEEKHIIHRDIKPANIFAAPDGSFKLGDFGVSRQVLLSSVRSQKGTSAYMAPEVARGEAYDKTVDIYSLGIVLYRLLNDNRLPFLPAAPEPMRYEDHQRAIQRRFSGAAMPLPAHGGGALGAIVCRACAYRPEERYPSAGALKAALLEWMSAQPEKAQPLVEAPPPEETLPPIRELSQEPSSPELAYGTQDLFATHYEHPDVIRDWTQELSTPSQPEALPQEDSLPPQPVEELPQEFPSQPEAPQVLRHGDYVRLAGEETLGLFETTIPPKPAPASEAAPEPALESELEPKLPPEPLPESEGVPVPEPPEKAVLLSRIGRRAIAAGAGLFLVAVLVLLGICGGMDQSQLSITNEELGYAITVPSEMRGNFEWSATADNSDCTLKLLAGNLACQPFSVYVTEEESDYGLTLYQEGSHYIKLGRGLLGNEIVPFVRDMNQFYWVANGIRDQETAQREAERVWQKFYDLSDDILFVSADGTEISIGKCLKANYGPVDEGTTVVSIPGGPEFALVMPDYVAEHNPLATKVYTGAKSITLSMSRGDWPLVVFSRVQLERDFGALRQWHEYGRGEQSGLYIYSPLISDTLAKTMEVNGYYDETIEEAMESDWTLFYNAIDEIDFRDGDNTVNLGEVIEKEDVLA